jgi:hypothetical protein
MSKLSIMMAALLLTSPSWAAWRCDGWIIDSPQSLYEVGRKCGNPVSVESRTEWRTQTSYEQRCANVQVPVESNAVQMPAAGGSATTTPQPAVTYQTRTVCENVPVSYTVPVEVRILYYDDNVPKALHFESGRLRWIEDLWNLRHHGSN